MVLEHLEKIGTEKAGKLTVGVGASWALVPV